MKKVMYRSEPLLEDGHFPQWIGIQWDGACQYVTYYSNTTFRYQGPRAFETMHEALADFKSRCKELGVSEEPVLC